MLSLVCVDCSTFLNSIQTVTNASYPKMPPNNPYVSTVQPHLCWMGQCDNGTWLYYEIGKACLSSIVELSVSAPPPPASPRGPEATLKEGGRNITNPEGRSCLAQWIRLRLPFQDLKQNSHESRIEASEFSLGLSERESLSSNWGFPGLLSCKPAPVKWISLLCT